MARVALLSLMFAPDHVSTAQLLGELVVDLRGYGHDVTVVTTRPHYVLNEVELRAQPLRPLWSGIFQRSDFKGIPVIHTWMPAKGRGMLDRLIGWAVFQVLALVALFTIVRRADVVVVQSPLLPLALVAWLFGVFRGSRYIYNVWELYPDLAIDAGFVRNGGLIAVLRRLERFAYAQAAAVTVATRGFQERLLARGVPASKIYFCPNFVDLDDLAPLPRDNAFAREHGWGDKFVVSYAGNMGPMQGLEFIVAAAALLVEEKDIVFLFIGSGGRVQSLRADVAARGLDNVKFLDQLPYERVPEIYAASDVSIVALRFSIGHDAVPSKVFRIMACARPVLAFTGESSDLADVVRESGGGVVVPSPSAEALAAAILELRTDPARRATMGAAGREFVSRFYSRRSVSAAFHDVITDVVRVHEPAMVAQAERKAMTGVASADRRRS